MMNWTPEREPMLTPAQAAKRLQVSVRTLMRLVHAGRLAAVRLGERTVRIPESALTAPAMMQAARARQ